MIASKFRLAFVALVAAIVGGVVGAAVYALVLDDNENVRGNVILLRDLASNPDIDESPFCVSAQKFCVVRLVSGELRALYMYETHFYSRGRNCEIRWLPDFRFPDPETGNDATGWFRGDCSGTTYRITGEYVYGPGARDMDRFAIESKSSTENLDGQAFEVRYLEVNTTRLICGEALLGAPAECEWAPLPQ